MRKQNLQQQLKSLLRRKQSNSFYAKRLGVSLEELLELKKSLTDPDASSTKTTKINNDKGTLESSMETTFEPKTDEELAELHKIDLTKYKISNYWSKLQTNGNFTSSVFATLKRVDQDLSLQKEIILEELKELISGSSLLQSVNSFIKELKKVDVKKKDNLLEISIPDLHLGKLSHSEESGEDYDIKIATERYKAAVLYLLRTANIDNVTDILLPIGNDLINVDNQFSTTSAGTPQDCDTRFHKMIKVAKKLLIDTITSLSAFAKVHVLIVPGNHDETTMFMIGEILDAYFAGNHNVHINNSPKLRKYFKWGSNSFLYCHGDKEKVSDLGLIFATEEAQLWADTKHRFVKLGHLHKQKKLEYMTTDSHQGFQVEILPSLSSADKWHYGKGFLGNRQAKAYLYDKEHGEIAQYTYTV